MMKKDEGGEDAAACVWTYFECSVFSSRVEFSLALWRDLKSRAGHGARAVGFDAAPHTQDCMSVSTPPPKPALSCPPRQHREGRKKQRERQTEKRTITPESRAKRPPLSEAQKCPSLSRRRGHKGPPHPNTQQAENEKKKKSRISISL